MDHDLLAYVTPASAWHLHPAVFQDKFHLDCVSEDEPNIPSQVLLGLYH